MASNPAPEDILRIYFDTRKPVDPLVGLDFARAIVDELEDHFETVELLNVGRGSFLVEVLAFGGATLTLAAIGLSIYERIQVGEDQVGAIGQDLMTESDASKCEVKVNNDEYVIRIEDIRIAVPERRPTLAPTTARMGARFDEYKQRAESVHDRDKEIEKKNHYRLKTWERDGIISLDPTSDLDLQGYDKTNWEEGTTANGSMAGSLTIVDGTLWIEDVEDGPIQLVSLIGRIPIAPGTKVVVRGFESYLTTEETKRLVPLFIEQFRGINTSLPEEGPAEQLGVAEEDASRTGDEQGDDYYGAAIRHLETKGRITYTPEVGYEKGTISLITGIPISSISGIWLELDGGHAIETKRGQHIRLTGIIGEIPIRPGSSVTVHGHMSGSSRDNNQTIVPTKIHFDSS